MLHSLTDTPLLLSLGVHCTPCCLQPAYLKLRLRPDDPYSHPLFGERVPQAGLLLRIARPKGQPDAAPSVTCVSRVSATYAYNGMADYQVGLFVSWGNGCAEVCSGIIADIMIS